MKRAGNTISIVLVMLIMLVTIFSHQRELFNISKKLFLSIKSEETITKEQLAIFEEDYQKILQADDGWINGYGISQRLLLKRDLGDVLCDRQGILYLKDNSNVTNEEINQAATNICSLFQCAKELDIPFLFVQCPYKNYSKVKELQGYGVDKTEENEDELTRRLMEKEIPVLDLREYLAGTVHYKTDHHWTCEAAFKANNIISQYVYEEFGMAIDKGDLEFYCNEKHYNKVCYPASFLGSMGIRVGEGYIGKEDFSIFVPDFYTSFDYTHFVNNEISSSYSGNFIESFIDETLLLDTNYKNKYMAFLHGGYAENVIVNQVGTNELKALYISHSYGRAIVPYMSLFYKEVRYLDPQVGRYNESYLEYIQKYKPDVIIVMFNGEIQL